MGIKLDWQVESEQTHLQAVDHPENQHRRRRDRRRLFLLITGLASVLIMIGAGIVWRLQNVDGQLRQDLLDTVQIEVTALRLGNLADYMTLQRSASDVFMLEQSRKFEEYQQLKLSRRVELTGEVLDVAIENQRGRVIVQEKIDGVPYTVAWFYWHYEGNNATDQGGWRRVPDDLTFWGDAQVIDTGTVHLAYHTLDADLAQALAPRLADWWIRGCKLVECTLPPLRAEIVAEQPASITWDTNNTWLLRITSPQVGRARADMPLPPTLERDIATQVATRLVQHVTGASAPAAHTDAAWMQAELTRWLTEALLPRSEAASPGFMENIITYYGPGAPGMLLRALGYAVTLDDLLSPVIGVAPSLLSVEQLNALDWTHFFQWRLSLETQLLAQPINHREEFLTLYDQDNVYAASEALLRLETPVYAARSDPQVQGVTIMRDDYSQLYAYSDIITEDDAAPPQTIIWRWTGGTWKRTS